MSGALTNHFWNNNITMRQSEQLHTYGFTVTAVAAQPALTVRMRPDFTWEARKVLGMADGDAAAVHALGLYEVSEATLPQEQAEPGVWCSFRVTAGDGRLFLVTEQPSCSEQDGRCQLIAIDEQCNAHTFACYGEGGVGATSKKKRVWHSGSADEELKREGCVALCSSALSAVSLWLRTHRDDDDAAAIAETAHGKDEAGDDTEALERMRRRRCPEVAWLHDPQRGITKTVCYMLQYVGSDRILLSDGDSRSRRQAYAAARAMPFFRCAMLPEHLVLPLYRVDDTDAILLAIANAETVNPFEHIYKYNKKNEIVGTEYRIDSTRIWFFMQSLGYRQCLSDGDDRFKTQLLYVNQENGFVSYVPNENLVSLTMKALDDYAVHVAKVCKWDYHALRNVITRSRDITANGIAFLPIVNLDTQASFGPDVDYFYYKNGCLKITPTDIIFHKGYDDLPFVVFENQLVPFDFAMPDGVGEKPPFIITENPEYRERMETFKAHQADKEHSQDELDVEQNSLTRWAQHHRWKIIFPQSKVGEDGLEDRSEWWDTLKVIRGYANNQWREEYELNRHGKDFNDEQQGELQAHFANIIYTIGHLLYRYRGEINIISYIMENDDIDETKSEGGTGKSFMINYICGCAGNILTADCRAVNSDSEMATRLSDFDPSMHRIIHFEDCCADFPFDKLFCYSTREIVYRKLHKDPKKLPVRKSPGLVITSNYAPTGNDTSSDRRRCICGVSHYFHAKRHGHGRSISDVLPAARDLFDSRDGTARCQFAYIAALAVQFAMNVKDRVEQPSEMADLRADYAYYGRPFVQFASELLRDEKHFGCPLHTDTLFDDYKAVCEPSDMRKSSYSMRRFRENIIQYAALRDVVVNPDVVYSPTSNDKANGKQPRFRTWVKHTYFTDSNFANVHAPVTVRELSDTAVSTLWLFHKGQVPTDYAEVKALAKAYISGQDPDPYLDGDGKPVRGLTDEERQMHETYIYKKVGPVLPGQQPPAVKPQPPVKDEPVEPPAGLPF